AGFDLRILREVLEVDRQPIDLRDQLLFSEQIEESRRRRVLRNDDDLLFRAIHSGRIEEGREAHPSERRRAHNDDDETCEDLNEAPQSSSPSAASFLRPARAVNFAVDFTPGISSPSTSFESTGSSAAFFQNSFRA